MSDSEDVMKAKAKILLDHYDTFEKDSMTPDQFKEWNAALVNGFFDYQESKSVFILGHKAAAAAKALVKQ